MHSSPRTAGYCFESPYHPIPPSDLATPLEAAAACGRRAAEDRRRNVRLDVRARRRRPGRQPSRLAVSSFRRQPRRRAPTPGNTRVCSSTRCSASAAGSKKTKRAASASPAFVRPSPATRRSRFKRTIWKGTKSRANLKGLMARIVAARNRSPGRHAVHRSPRPSARPFDPRPVGRVRARVPKQSRNCASCRPLTKWPTAFASWSVYERRRVFPKRATRILQSHSLPAGTHSYASHHARNRPVRSPHVACPR